MTKKFLILLIFVAVILHTTGCAQLLCPVAEVQKAKNACLTAQVLYTDLLKPADARIYELQNGSDCSEYYHD